MSVNFEESGARRIVGATKWVEQHTRNPVRLRGDRGHRGDGGIWAKITDKGTEDNSYKYAWQQVVADANGDMQPALLSGTVAENYAIASDKSEAVPQDSIVWLLPSRNQEFYLFANPANQGFWAKIGEGDAWKYGWTQLVPSEADDGTYTEGDLSAEHDDDNFAVSFDGSEHVLPYSVVWLQPTGSFFTFYYAPGLITAKLVSASTIPGRQGATPGSTTVTIERFNGIALNNQGEYDNITVYNNFRSSISGEGGDELYLQLTYGQGVWWLSAVDCLKEDEEDEEE